MSHESNKKVLSTSLKRNLLMLQLGSLNRACRLHMIKSLGPATASFFGFFLDLDITLKAVTVSLKGQIDHGWTFSVTDPPVFEETRRWHYQEAHPRWYVPDLDMRQNTSIQLEYRPTIFAPLVHGEAATGGYLSMLADECHCGNESAGFGNACATQQWIHFPSGRSFAQSFHTMLPFSRKLDFLKWNLWTIDPPHAGRPWLFYYRNSTSTWGASICLFQHRLKEELTAGNGTSSISSNASKLTNWLLDVTVSGKTVGLRLTDSGNSVRLFEAEVDESKLRSVFTTSIPTNLLVNQASQLVLTPTQDMTDDSEVLAVPLEVISHPPRLNVSISNGFLLPNPLGSQERADLAACCVESLDSVTATLEDSRFEAGSFHFQNGVSWEYWQITPGKVAILQGLRRIQVLYMQRDAPLI